MMYKAIKLIHNKVYSILIENWDEEITGVFIAEGKEWLLLLDNQNDFIVEGFRFVHKSKIEEILREEDEIFKERVFAKKYGEFSNGVSYNLDDSSSLLSQICEEQKLFHFDTDDEEEMIVGRIETVKNEVFHVLPLTSEAIWDESFSCSFSEISTIALDNDYLKSLSLVID